MVERRARDGERHRGDGRGPGRFHLPKAPPRARSDRDRAPLVARGGGGRDHAKRRAVEPKSDVRIARKATPRTPAVLRRRPQKVMLLERRPAADPIVVASPSIRHPRGATREKSESGERASGEASTSSAKSRLWRPRAPDDTDEPRPLSPRAYVAPPEGRGRVTSIFFSSSFSSPSVVLLARSPSCVSTAPLGFPRIRSPHPHDVSPSLPPPHAVHNASNAEVSPDADATGVSSASAPASPTSCDAAGSTPAFAAASRASPPPSRASSSNRRA